MKVRDAMFVGLIISTLFIKELWKFYPYSDQTFKMFPYSDVMITRQTYFWFFCFYAIQIIVVASWYYKFEEYRLIFGAWFIFQVLEVSEYYFTYNEPHFWIWLDRKEENRIGLNVIKFKYITVITLSIRHFYLKLRWSK
jgi:hypothetical protein